MMNEHDRIDIKHIAKRRHTARREAIPTESARTMRLRYSKAAFHP